MTDLNDFLGELASDSPTPGGGSVAALSGAMAAALTSMVANLTVGKKKYVDVEKDMKELLGESEALRVELAQMVDEDVEAFERVMVAMKLPKETPEDEARRSAALQSALVDAAMVPLAVMEKCALVIDLARRAAEKGNRNAVSDAGVAALLGRAGAHAARLNVLINLAGIRAQEFSTFREDARAQTEALAARADRASDDVLSLVLARLS
jgi:formiminotetrahydrofolate cyclodeaminase